MNKLSVFFCDHCSKYDNNNRKFFNTFDKSKYNKHLTTSKHLENVEKNKKCEPCFECDYCNETYDNKGYEEHKRKNQKLWNSLRGLKITYGTDLFKNRFSDLKCNHFVVDKKRYNNFDEMCEKGDVRILPIAKPSKHVVKRTKKQSESDDIQVDENHTMDKRYRKLIFMTYCPDCCLIVNDIDATEEQIRFNFNIPYSQSKQTYQRFFCSCKYESDNSDDENWE